MYFPINLLLLSPDVTSSCCIIMPCNIPGVTLYLFSLATFSQFSPETKRLGIFSPLSLSLPLVKPQTNSTQPNISYFTFTYCKMSRCSHGFFNLLCSTFPYHTYYLYIPSAMHLITTASKLFLSLPTATNLTYLTTFWLVSYSASTCFMLPHFPQYLYQLELVMCSYFSCAVITRFDL